MNREVHVRNCEGVGVKFPRATRLDGYVSFTCGSVGTLLPSELGYSLANESSYPFSPIYFACHCGNGT
jgi:hypothetical protein